MGMIYVSIGMLFAYYPIKMKGKYAIGGFILSILLLLGEAIALKWFDISRDHNMYIFLLPATFFLFYIATHIKLQNEKIYGVLRILGVLIFYLHMFVYWFVSKGVEYALSVGAPTYLDNSIVYYGSTAILSLALAFAIYKLSQSERFRWLKWIYS